MVGRASQVFQLLFTEEMKRRSLTPLVMILCWATLAMISKTAARAMMIWMAALAVMGRGIGMRPLA